MKDVATAKNNQFKRHLVRKTMMKMTIAMLGMIDIGLLSLSEVSEAAGSEAKNCRPLKRRKVEQLMWHVVRC